MCEDCTGRTELLQQSAKKLARLMEVHDEIIELLHERENNADWNEQDEMMREGGRLLKEFHQECAQLISRLGIVGASARRERPAMYLGALAGHMMEAEIASDPRMQLLAKLLGLDL